MKPIPNDPKKVKARRARNDAVRRFRYRRKQRALEILGGCCSKCGKEGGLIFAAKDVYGPWSALTKNLTVAEETFQILLSETVLLCDECYWKRLMKSRRRKPFRHGTMYGFYDKQCRCDECIAANDRRNSRRVPKRAGSSTG